MASSKPRRQERSFAQVRAQIMNAKHAFQVLGVHRSMTAEQIDAARRDLAKYVHPDVCATRDANELMSRVNAAHSELTTRMYRYVLELNGKPCAACKERGCAARQAGFTKVVETVCRECHGAGVVL